MQISGILPSFVPKADTQIEESKEERAPKRQRIGLDYDLEKIEPHTLEDTANILLITPSGHFSNSESEHLHTRHSPNNEINAEYLERHHVGGITYFIDDSNYHKEFLGTNLFEYQREEHISEEKRQVMEQLPHLHTSSSDPQFYIGSNDFIKVEQEHNNSATDNENPSEEIIDIQAFIMKQKVQLGAMMQSRVQNDNEALRQQLASMTSMSRQNRSDLRREIEKKQNQERKEFKQQIVAQQKEELKRVSSLYQLQKKKKKEKDVLFEPVKPTSKHKKMRAAELRQQRINFDEHFVDRERVKNEITTAWLPRTTQPPSVGLKSTQSVPTSPGVVCIRDCRQELVHWQHKILPIVKHRLGILRYRSDRLDNLLTLSFIHTSLVKEEENRRIVIELLGTTWANYERLEHVGDAFLNYVVASYLYNIPGNLTAGEMTMRRTVLASNRIIAFLMRELGLHRFILRQKYLPLNIKMTADVFESIIGALVQVLGEQITQSIVYSLFERLIANLSHEEILTIPDDDGTITEEAHSGTESTMQDLQQVDTEYQHGTKRKREGESDDTAYNTDDSTSLLGDAIPTIIVDMPLVNSADSMLLEEDIMQSTSPMSHSSYDYHADNEATMDQPRDSYASNDLYDMQDNNFEHPYNEIRYNEQWLDHQEISNLNSGTVKEKE